jgi:DNA primase
MTLLELVQQEVTLRHASRGEWCGLCPFHAEKTPSFSVNEEKGLFYCFGCGAKGDAVTWLVRKRGLTMVDALRLVGKELPESEREKARRKRAAREDILKRFFAWKHEKAKWITFLHDEIFFAEMAYRSICRTPEIWPVDEQDYWITYIGDLYLSLSLAVEENNMLANEAVAWQQWQEEAKAA